MHPESVERHNRPRLGMIIVMIPAGAILGFLGGLVIEITVGFIAGAAFSADDPASLSCLAVSRSIARRWRPYRCSPRTHPLRPQPPSRSSRLTGTPNLPGYSQPDADSSVHI